MAIEFPTIGERRVGRVIRELEGLDLEEGVNVRTHLHKYANKRGVALHVGFTFEHALEDCSIVSSAVDDCLSEEGIHFNPSEFFDRRYGSTQKYYFIKTRGGIWVGIGDNCYGETEGRLLINWHERLIGSDISSANDAILGLDIKTENVYSYD